MLCTVFETAETKLNVFLYGFAAAPTALIFRAEQGALQLELQDWQSPAAINQLT